MELTKEQVQRIDNFLKGLGFEYIDIRLEMVDHIASEIENNIKDVAAFFNEEEKLRSQFLKYMLSKKHLFIKRYDNQVKRLSIYYLKSFFKDLFKQIITVKNLTLISLLTLLSFQFGDVFFKELSYFYFSLIIGSYVVLYFTLSYLKKHKNIRLIRFYAGVNSTLLMFNFYFPNILDTFVQGNFSKRAMYMLLVSVIVTFLVHSTILAKKKFIKHTYGYLIN